jgi:hypothetical protein
MCFGATAHLAQRKEVMSLYSEGWFGCCSSASLQLAKKLAASEQDTGKVQYVPLSHFAEKLAAGAAQSEQQGLKGNSARGIAQTPVLTPPPSLLPRQLSPTAIMEMEADKQSQPQPGAKGTDDICSGDLKVPDLGNEGDISNALQASAAEPSVFPPTDSPLVELSASEGERSLEAASAPDAAKVDIGFDVRPQDEQLENLDAEGVVPTDADWGTGSVHVLLLSNGGAAGAGSSSFPDAAKAARIEQWCRRCNIDDVTFPVVETEQDSAPVSEQLKHILTVPMLARTRPGDTWFIHAAGIEEGVSNDMHTDGNVDTIGGAVSPFVEDSPAAGIQEQAKVAVPLELLPPHVTIVCLTDSERSLERLGLQESRLTSLADHTFRIVVMMLLPSDPISTSVPQRGDLCANSMLRAADALSLADGPCGLTCDDFFQELADQACELSAAIRIPVPQVVLKAHPMEDNLAAAIRWPIAALPHNKSKGGITLSNAAMEFSMPVSESREHPAPTFVADFGLAFSSMTPEASRQPSPQPVAAADPHPAQKRSNSSHLLPRSSWPSPPRAAERRRSGSTRADKVVSREYRESRSASGSRAMPTNLSGLSAMLTGGGLKGTRNTTAQHSREPRGQSASVSRENRQPRVQSGARAMPTNFDGLSLMLTGGGFKEASQQKPDTQESNGSKRRRGSTGRRRSDPPLQAVGHMEQEAIE